MFKLYACLTMGLLFASGCTSVEKETTSLDEEQQTPLHETAEIQEADYTTADERQLTLYNEAYVLRIVPAVASEDDRYSVAISLDKEGASVFHQVITLDTLAQAALRQFGTADSLAHQLAADNKVINKVVYNGVRSGNLYFVADITTKPAGKDQKLLFQIAYKDVTGLLIFNGVSDKGWPEFTMMTE